jgi:hypothetical protein
MCLLRLSNLASGNESVEDTPGPIAPAERHFATV